MSIKLDLEKAVANLNLLPAALVPKASAQAVNRVSSRASGRAIRLTAKDARVRVPAKLIRPRVKIFKATPQAPNAVIRVRRRPIPMIRLGPAQQRLTRRGGRYQAGDMQVGRHRVPGGFVADGSKGFGQYRRGGGYASTALRSWQILRRVGKGRHALEVMRIPLVTPITEHYEREAKAAMSRDMPREMQQALLRQLKLAIK
ncbi:MULTISPECIES: phage tail protein [Aeromonas]|uniref:phage tail protein n=1 Tax=Aeromonas TaxID=642 RepID=UPI0009561CD1|nr:phage tail protein [Aeromonas hydrophila]SIP88490.1 Prophage minor tail protein Z (GPZ) [Aeromonas hydrophila]SIR30443.1 Prophage minor tail protein Z (GPZ) [Aeromonas hydrophila]